MKIDIHSLHFDAGEKLLSFIDTKVSKLDRFHDGIVTVDVTLKLEKSDISENKIAEIKVQIPGENVFCSRQAKTFEEAVDLSVDALKKQLQKAKEKQR
ncbi:MAG: ribosome-associated translation inhibitor RaiA [Salinivirgaceae bacterium]|nr:ribosome-associated translation inhibitor RaiA [Salinivirgaceae bacterium]MBO7433449.1 ribosome-associated translation inhibitor RaiA [Salinivirgaceae bacterium]MBO7593516.1 ribosome-associated translation inhibitor RaiA [Salinivirgaceae bacterium]MBR5167971.1 ribosome-associated translation inhibitor RaiA [Salinivirgaceae bacterium]